MSADSHDNWQARDKLVLRLLNADQSYHITKSTTPLIVQLTPLHEDKQFPRGRLIVLEPEVEVPVGRASRTRLNHLPGRFNGLFFGDVISRNHAVLVSPDGHKVCFKDVGSYHGTKLNNVHMAPHISVTLKSGDIIEIAPTTGLIRETHSSYKMKVDISYPRELGTETQDPLVRFIRDRSLDDYISLMGSNPRPNVTGFDGIMPQTIIRPTQGYENTDRLPISLGMSHDFDASHQSDFRVSNDTPSLENSSTKVNHEGIPTQFGIGLPAENTSDGVSAPQETGIFTREMPSPTFGHLVSPIITPAIPPTLPDNLILNAPVMSFAVMSEPNKTITVPPANHLTSYPISHLLNPRSPALATEGSSGSLQEAPLPSSPPYDGRWNTSFQNGWQRSGQSADGQSNEDTQNRLITDTLFSTILGSSPSSRSLDSDHDYPDEEDQVDDFFDEDIDDFFDQEDEELDHADPHQWDRPLFAPFDSSQVTDSQVPEESRKRKHSEMSDQEEQSNQTDTVSPESNSSRKMKSVRFRQATPTPAGSFRRFLDEVAGPSSDFDTQDGPNIEVPELSPPSVRSGSLSSASAEERPVTPPAANDTDVNTEIVEADQPNDSSLSEQPHNPPLALVQPVVQSLATGSEEVERPRKRLRTVAGFMTGGLTASVAILAAMIYTAPDLV